MVVVVVQMDQKTHKWKGRAQKLGEKRQENINVDAAKRAKITDMFATTSSGPRVGLLSAPVVVRGEAAEEEREEEEEIDVTQQQAQIEVRIATAGPVRSSFEMIAEWRELMKVPLLSNNALSRFGVQLTVLSVFKWIILLP